MVTGRQELGDIEGLAQSIQALGLLQPVGVTPDLKLMFGARRLRACELLDWERIPARIIPTLSDAVCALQAERDENICRKDFSISKALALGERLEAIESEAARERQRVHGGTAPGKHSGKLSLSVGRARDRVAAALGMSGRNYEKAKAVCLAAQDEPERFGKILQRMERSGKVDRAYRLSNGNYRSPPDMRHMSVVRGIAGHDTYQNAKDQAEMLEGNIWLAWAVAAERAGARYPQVFGTDTDKRACEARIMELRNKRTVLLAEIGKSYQQDDWHVHDVRRDSSALIVFRLALPDLIPIMPKQDAAERLVTCLANRPDPETWAA